MDTIDLKRWLPSTADSRKLEYAGARTAQEVYEELKYRLESTGYLPDEYFLLNAEWDIAEETVQSLSDYWSEILSVHEQSGPQMGGPVLG